MFLFGFKVKHTPGSAIEHISCSNCQKYQIKSFGILRYFHVWGIPTLLTSKEVGTKCTNCNEMLIGKEIAQDLRQDLLKNTFNISNTITRYSGIILIALMILYNHYDSYRTEINTENYIKQPLVGDLYIINYNDLFENKRYPSFKYNVMRIKNLSATSIEFQVSNSVYKTAYDVHKVIRDHKDNYNRRHSFYIDLSKLQGLKDAGTITSIERDSVNQIPIESEKIWIKFKNSLT